MVYSCSHSHGSSFYSSIFGPLYTVKDTYDLLVNHIGVDKDELYKISLLGFAGSFVFSVGAAFVRTRVVETSLKLMQCTLNKELPSDLRTLIAIGISYKLLESAFKVCSEFFQKRTSGIIINETYKKYKPREDSQKEQIVHHINKVIEHSVHYVFESASALYSFGYGLYVLRNSQCDIKATALFVLGSIGVNYLIQSTIHNKLHAAKEQRNKFNTEAQKALGDNNYKYNSEIGFSAIKEGFWKSVYEEAGSISTYLSEKMRAGVCLFTLMNDPSVNVALLLDSLEKVGEFFAHALEHGDDTADDRVFTKRIIDTLENEGHQR